MGILAEGLVIALLGLGALWGALQIPEPLPGEVGAGLFPLLISVALIVLGSARATSSLLQRAEAGAMPLRREILEVSGLALLSLVYWWAIGAFGYLLATAAAAPLALFAFGIRRPGALILSALLCPLIYHLVFFEALGVFPPYGEIFDLLDVLRGS